MVREKPYRCPLYIMGMNTTILCLDSKGWVHEIENFLKSINDSRIVIA